MPAAGDVLNWSLFYIFHFGTWAGRSFESRSRHKHRSLAASARDSHEVALPPRTDTCRNTYKASRPASTDQPRVGTSACRTFSPDSKASKRANLCNRTADTIKQFFWTLKLKHTVLVTKCI